MGSTEPIKSIESVDTVGIACEIISVLAAHKVRMCLLDTIFDDVKECLEDLRIVDDDIRKARRVF
jgi:hypothetical protein